MSKPLKVLVGYEYSGRVREAFRLLGHDAWSCDLLPCEDMSPFHIQDDVLSILGDGWDLAVFHPPCTYLCNSGVRWLHTQPERREHMREGAEFFKQLLECKIPRVAVENPVMHKYARDIIGCGPTQIVQPWMFGETQTKATGLWLRGLPPLVPTNNVREAMLKLPVRDRSAVHYASPGPQRWRLRSRTFQGLATAMSIQWS